MPSSYLFHRDIFLSSDLVVYFWVRMRSLTMENGLRILRDFISPWPCEIPVAGHVMRVGHLARFQAPRHSPQFDTCIGGRRSMTCNLLSDWLPNPLRRWTPGAPPGLTSSLHFDMLIGGSRSVTSASRPIGRRIHLSHNTYALIGPWHCHCQKPFPTVSSGVS